MFAWWSSFDRHESASAFVVNDLSKRLPATIHRTRYDRPGFLAEPFLARSGRSVMS